VLGRSWIRISWVGLVEVGMVAVVAVVVEEAEVSFGRESREP
jgi:hypothetical protein